MAGGAQTLKAPLQNTIASKPIENNMFLYDVIIFFLLVSILNQDSGEMPDKFSK